MAKIFNMYFVCLPGTDLKLNQSFLHDCSLKYFMYLFLNRFKSISSLSVVIATTKEVLDVFCPKIKLTTSIKSTKKN